MDWDSEEEPAYPVTLRHYRDELDQPEPVLLPKDRDDFEGPVHLLPIENDDETTIEYPVQFKPDELLDEPEWGTRKIQSAITLKTFTRPWDGNIK
jgi:hypothetical protein